MRKQVRAGSTCHPSSRKMGEWNTSSDIGAFLARRVASMNTLPHMVPTTRTTTNEGRCEMNTFKLRIWTGPTLVKEVTTKLREAGVEVVEEGTEHVHVRSEGSDRLGAAHNVL